MLPNHKAPAVEEMDRSAVSMISSAAAVAAGYLGLRAAMPLDYFARTKPHRHLVLLHTAHDYTTSFPTTVASSRKQAAILPRDVMP